MRFLLVLVVFVFWDACSNVVPFWVFVCLAFGDACSYVVPFCFVVVAFWDSCYRAQKGIPGVVVLDLGGPFRREPEMDHVASRWGQIGKLNRGYGVKGPSLLIVR